jgi:hypothetical protein
MTELHPDLQAALDARLNDAIAAANYRLTLNNQKQNARLKLQKDLIYAKNGGMFNISPELISFIQSLISMGKEDAILLDINKNPIEISDLLDFQEAIVAQYYECMNDFLYEFKSLQKSRTTKALIGE